MRNSITIIFAMAAVLLLELSGGISPADAHGASTRPGSRTYLCRIDGTHASGDINPSNAACAAAVAVGGKQPLWDWFGVLRGDGAGRTRGFIPDGQLCSGGEPKYAGYDLPRADWPHTRLTSGGDLAVRYNAWAAHPGEFRLYVTKDGFDPTSPLRWDDLEDAPFSVYNQDSPNGNDAQNGTPDYQWNVKLPNKTGQHIIYSVWSRSDSQETFYGCSDVRFDGGNGQVVGVGAGANPVGAPDGGSAPVTPAPATTAAPAAATTVPPAPATTVAPAPTAVPATEAPASAAATPESGSDSTMIPAGVSVAGTVASTDGAVALQPAVNPAAPVANQAAPVIGQSAEVDQAAFETASAAGQGGLPAATNSTGWIAIIATAVAGLAVGVVLSIVAYSSPRARRAYRQLFGDVTGVGENYGTLRPAMVPSASPPAAPSGGGQRSPQ